MKSNNLYDELLKRNYLVLSESSSSFKKQSQRSGSPLDRYRNEILFFRYEEKCSYSDIAKWLSLYKNIERSPSRIAKKIKLWEEENATKKKSITE